MIKEIKLNYTNSKLSKELIQDYSNLLYLEINSIVKLEKKKYSSNYASISLCNDRTFIEQSKQFAKKYQQYNHLILIGIGGSNLGTMSILSALDFKLKSSIPSSNNKTIDFLDTTDSINMSLILTSIKEKIEKKEKILINLISKSGSTTESIANFQIILDLLKNIDSQSKYSSIIITTDNDSPLEKYGQKNKFDILNIPHNVGGRYSVFSNVGLFPLTFMGVDVEELIKGAKDMCNICLEKNNKNPAIISALSIFHAKNNNKNILNHFFFSTNLNTIGLWYRQLLAESIGKEYLIDNKTKVNSSIIPTISIGSTDLHSMAQLYLGGQDNIFHIFIKIKNVPKIQVPKEKDLDKIVSNIGGKNMSEILSAIYGGIINSFKEKQRSFLEIELKEISEYSLGAFLQLKMFEVIFLAKLLGVNAFDQPNVEDYKKITKKLLQNE